jgi:hypothetical protein
MSRPVSRIDLVAASRCLIKVALAVLAVLPLGCAVEAQERVGSADQGMLYANALDPSALTSGALTPSALSPSALNPCALSPSAMSALRDPGSAGNLARELLRYTVGCAFAPHQSFAFSWTDSLGVEHDEAYVGLASLSPDWATQPLDPTGQQWVSDCLASRVNAEGVSVMLSSRGTNPALACSWDELATYQTREAVWFGNLFTSTPTVYACYDPLSMLPSQMAKRVCAEPDLLKLDLNDLPSTYSCGPIEVIGPCTQVLGLLTVGYCASQDPVDRYFYNCAPHGGAPVIPSITTFLHGIIPW